MNAFASKHFYSGWKFERRQNTVKKTSHRATIKTYWITKTVTSSYVNEAVVTYVEWNLGVK